MFNSVGHSLLFLLLFYCLGGVLLLRRSRVCSVVDLFNVGVYWFSVGLLLGFSLRYCVLLVWGVSLRVSFAGCLMLLL